MAEPKIEAVTTETTEVAAEEVSRLKSFTLNHPRTAKVVGILALTGATLGAMQVWKSRKQFTSDAETQESDETPFEPKSEIA